MNDHELLDALEKQKNKLATQLQIAEGTIEFIKKLISETADTDSLRTTLENYLFTSEDN